MENNNAIDDDISGILTNLFTETHLNNPRINTGAFSKRIINPERRYDDPFKNVFAIRKSDPSERSYWRSGDRRVQTLSWRNKNEEREITTGNWRNRAISSDRNETLSWRLQQNNNQDHCSRKSDQDYGWQFIGNNDVKVRKAKINKEDILKSEEFNIYLIQELQPDNITETILEKMQCFDKILQSSLSFVNTVLILRVIDKMCLSNLTESKCKIVLCMMRSQFLHILQKHLLCIATHNAEDKETYVLFWSNPKQFWNNLLSFYDTIFHLLPQTARDKLPQMVKATTISLNDIEKYHNITVSDDLKDKLQSVYNKLQSYIKTDEKKDVGLLEPPNSFREMTVFPTVAEVTTHQESFIRPIIKDGAYQSVEHYLDVQFRLLKEDFTASLRNGICSYLKRETSLSVDKQFDVRIYENVQFIRPTITYNTIAGLVQYTRKIDKNILENSKRFIFGSLVCFTCDHFQNIVFGIVVDNDAKYLRKGQIVVDVKDGFVKYEHNYTMVESTVFFEPYYQVLTALQNINESNFPFKDYIIDIASDTKPPKYINKVTKAYFEKDKYEFKVLSPETWPKPEQVELNQSQFEAFKNAITNEFCVIQGPPGTGKTYTTLKIVEFLIRNNELLGYDGPILVICFTNHALDQFLEGILPFTKDIVRVGGQSKSPKLEKFNITRFRRIIKKIKKRRNKTPFDDYFSSDDDDKSSGDEDYNFNDYFHEVYSRENSQISREFYLYSKQLHAYEETLNTILLSDGIIKFNNFNGILYHDWFQSRTNDEIFDWLMHGYEDEYQGSNVNIEQGKMDEDVMKSDDDFILQLNEIFNDRKIDDNLFENTFNFSKNNKYIIRTKDFLNYINYLQMELNELSRENEYQKCVQYEMVIEDCLKKYKYLVWRLNECQVEEVTNLPEVNMRHPLLLTPDERWTFYKHWLYILRLNFYKKITDKVDKFRSMYDSFQKVNQLNDVYIMQKMKVIGMTTTGAARYQHLLQKIRCPIVIAEEAAEVLESHIVVSLTKDCQHLILIGDHKQLRPSTAQHFLATKYNLEVSLFERMVRNGIHCTQLNIQHRMRPEIANLIVPAIYPELQNHQSVEYYPPVLGVTKSLFFVSHTQYEDNVRDSTSHVNEYEARYLIALARYLIYQGYEPKDITILTTYKGQMYCLLKKIQNQVELSGVRITVVDNFQGEENKIILLSLVRSNENASIGFLKIENRVCVALSRAREGFFIIGNMENLEKASTLWQKIKEALIKQNAISYSLTLQCQIHSTITLIHRPEDFAKVSLGGCNLMCNTELPCGYICKLQCHTADVNHERYFCKEKCTKKCPRNHPCLSLCSSECKPCNVLIETKLPCNHIRSIPCSIDSEDYSCDVTVEAKLLCGHMSGKPCSEDITKARCLHPCDISLMCGHKCSKICHVRNDPEHINEPDCMEPCTRSKKGCSTKKHQCPLLCFEECPPCTDRIKKRRTICKHKYKVECSSDVDKLVCRQNCRKILPCGHYCPNKCFQPCGNCHVMVNKSIEECGHSIKVICSLEPTKSMCQEKCSSLLSCGHSCKHNCNETCSEKCVDCNLMNMLPEEHFNELEEIIE